MNFTPAHLLRFLNEGMDEPDVDMSPRIPSLIEVARYRRDNLRHNGQVRAEMNAAWKEKREREQRRIRNEKERLFRANETGNPAILNHGNVPTPVKDVIPRKNDSTDGDFSGFEIPGDPIDTNMNGGELPNEKKYVWHSFDEIPEISEEQRERDMGYDPMEKVRDFRHSMNGRRGRFGSRRPEIAAQEEDDFDM